MSFSARQVHTVLGGGIRYETVELVVSVLPQFELKQKGRILQLFAEIYNTFVQEIQEAMEERQNDLDSLLPANQTTGEPFAFESQAETDTQPVDLSSKSIDESESNVSNETLPVLAAAAAVTNPLDKTVCIKKELITPPAKTRRRRPTSKSKSGSSMRQMTMTQIFDPIDSPPSTSNNTTVIKNEPYTPSNDSMTFVPESQIGLAEPSDNPEERNNVTDLILPEREFKTSPQQSFKRKSIPSATSSDEPPEPTSDEEENLQNEAVLRSPYSGIDSEELLYACPMCRAYWLGLPEKLRHKKGLTCRHRQRPAAQTPEHFWSLGIPNTQTCIQRGYGGVLPPDKPVERPRRPRRQHQRVLHEKHAVDDDDL